MHTSQQHSLSSSTKIRQIPHLLTPHLIIQLSFPHNFIRTIPNHLALATHLTLLDLSHNKITHLQHLHLVSTLKCINLSHNLIAMVPGEIATMPGIEMMDLGYNRLGTIGSVKALK